MSATSSVLRTEITIPGRPGAELAAAIPSSANSLRFFSWFAALVSGFVSGLGARIRMGIEDSTPTAATGTVVFTQGSLTAGDWIAIGGVKYVAVAGAATASLGQFSKDTSNTAVGDSFVLALAAYPPGKPVAVGVNTTGSVALTAVVPGRAMNDVLMTESDASGGIALTQFSGGRDAGSLQSIIGTFTNAPADGGTLTIGAVVLTTAASPGNESEWDNGTDGPTAAANLIACINAHSKLKGLILASAGTTTSKVNIQLLQTGRIGNLIAVTEALTNYTQDAATFAPTQTSTWIASPAAFAVGASTTAQ